MILCQANTRYLIVLPRLENHFYPANFSSLYKNLVLLSCSSHSYTFAYCYYLPYIGLAWRRIGFEPVIFLVGSKRKFQKMPLIHVLNHDFRIKYHFINVDSSRSISTSQIIRLFGGFMTFDEISTKETFIIIGDVDLLPITRRRFEINTNHTNYILAVNAYCCPNEEFSYENFTNIHYYPMSYVGMRKALWKEIFLPLKHCSLSRNLTVNTIECYLKEKMNIYLPENVMKGSKQWDIDQKLLSLLLARTARFYGTYIDKRDLGYRLDPNENFLSTEFQSILFYDDIHLPNKNEKNYSITLTISSTNNDICSESKKLIIIYHYLTYTIQSIQTYARIFISIMNLIR